MAMSNKFEESEKLHCGDYRLSLDSPLVMGVLNVTPDSFSDGGKHASIDQAIAHAWTLYEEGADLLDVGGESTRPMANVVPVEEELARVIPVLERLLPDFPIPISIDTRHPQVMAKGLDLGVSMINDIYGLRAPGALELVAHYDAGICLMHMQGNPGTMQIQPTYQDVVADIRHFLAERVKACLEAGINRERLVIDPGLGFGKTVDQNFRLIAETPALSELGIPVLIGLSRKSFIGKIAGDLSVEDRVCPSVVGAVLAVAHGAAIVRVHDVAQTRQGLRILKALDTAYQDARI